MLPQPPASVDAPPASEAAKVSRRKRNRLVGAGVVSALGCVTVLFAPLLRRQRKCPDLLPAASDLRMIGLALFEFEEQYGSLPDASTVKRVREKTGSTLRMGTISSNDYFRQLLATGIVSDERIFFVFTRGGSGKPDNITTSAEALKKGECSFTYLLGTLASDNPGRPVAVAPMIPGTDRFDPKPFQGKAAILKRDNSVISLAIDKHGHVIFQGRNLMDPNHPVWEGRSPAIAWPEL